MSITAMGTPIPPEPSWTPDAPPAEKALWTWAVEQVPDRVRVLPGVRLSAVGPGDVDAEADLVLVDPLRGVLVVEVKGGTVSYDARHHRWFRDLGGGSRKEIRDPVEQAQRARALVRDALRDHRVADERLAVDWVVAVPECRLAAPGGSYLPEHKLWDALVTDQLARRYDAAAPVSTGGREPPGEALAERVVRTLRGRSVEGRDAVSARIAVHERAVLTHTESHRDALNAFAHHRRVLVRGAAGTGKTQLAVHAAARLAAQGERTLLVCWNAVLGRWLERSVRDRLAALGSPLVAEVAGDLGARVVAGNLPGLVHRAAGDEALDSEDASRRFHEQLPGLLDTDLCAGTFDAVVIDEAQDLSELWVLALGGLLRPDGRLFAFAHPDQDLFDAASNMQTGAGGGFGELCEHEHWLAESFRNTAEIAGAAGLFAEVLASDPQPVEHVAGHGPPVRWIAADAEHVPAAAREAAKLLRRDERLPDGDIAVLHLFNNPHRGDSAAVAAADSAGELVETNTATYKGLERPTVVLGLDLRADKTHRAAEVARAAYVGATRARSLLTVVGDPSLSRAFGFTKVADRLASGA